MVRRQGPVDADARPGEVVSSRGASLLGVVVVTPEAAHTTRLPLGPTTRVRNVVLALSRAKVVDGDGARARIARRQPLGSTRGQRLPEVGGIVGVPADALGARAAERVRVFRSVLAVVRDPILGAVGRLEEEVVAGPPHARLVISAEQRPRNLRPRAGRKRIGALVDGDGPDLVVGLPRVAAGIREEGPAVAVQRGRPFADFGAAAVVGELDDVSLDGPRVGHARDIQLLRPAAEAAAGRGPGKVRLAVVHKGLAVDLVGADVGDLGLERVGPGGVVAGRLEDVEPVAAVPLRGVAQPAVGGRVVNVPAELAPALELVQRRGPDLGAAAGLRVAPYLDGFDGGEVGQAGGLPDGNAASLGYRQVVVALEMHERRVRSGVEGIAELAALCGRKGERS